MITPSRKSYLISKNEYVHKLKMNVTSSSYCLYNHHISMSQELVLVAYALLFVVSIVQIIGTRDLTQQQPRPSLSATISPIPQPMSTLLCTRLKQGITSR